MKVLFIGGTGIISTAVTQLAVDRGIDLYLLNRGQSKKLVPNDVKVIKGDIRDRKAASKLLKLHDFDVVVNWVAYVPTHVEADIEFFRGKVGQYIFISSASAYQKPADALAHHRIDAAGQSLLAVFARQNRLRRPADG